jgi:dTDP-4-dehydrorhamnose reductase
MLGTEVGFSLGRRGVKFIASDKEVDITDQNAIDKYAGGHSLDWIVNCSGYTAVDAAEEEPEVAFKVNAEGVENLAVFAKKSNTKLLHISTDYVFDGAKSGAYLEDDAPNPMGIYGQSKLDGEIRIRENLDRHIIIRTAWLYGRHGRSFVSTMLRLFGERKQVAVVSDQRGTPTYAVDLADVIVRIVKDFGSRFGTYHFTNEGSTNWYEFAREIYGKARECGLVGKEVEIIPIESSDYPAKAKRPMNSLLSKEKIKRTFGMQIRRWEEALEEFLRNLRESA